MLDLEDLDDLNMQPEDREMSCKWHQVDTTTRKGLKPPGSISHHSSVIHNRKMYLFGGNTRCAEEEHDIYFLNLDTLQWNTLKPNGIKVSCRDEHTSVLHGDKMYVFGGFDRGERRNTIVAFDFKSESWGEVEATGKMPPPRAGHSACVYNGKMYVFGGKDEDNMKLRDLWSFDLEARVWAQLASCPNEIEPRSGHSACVFDHHMIIFAGIHEITKELDDLACFSFASGKWDHMFKAGKEKSNSFMHNT